MNLRAIYAFMDCIQPFPEAKLAKNQSGSTTVLWTFGIDLYPLDGWGCWEARI
jgi:hypothetical protein